MPSPKRRKRKVPSHDGTLDPSSPTGMLILALVPLAVFGFTFYNSFYLPRKAEQEAAAASAQRAKEAAHEKAEKEWLAKLEAEQLEVDRREAKRREVERGEINTVVFAAQPASVRFAAISPANTRKGTILVKKSTGKRSVVINRTASTISLIPESSLHIYENPLGEARVSGAIDTETWESVNNYYTHSEALK